MWPGDTARSHSQELQLGRFSSDIRKSFLISSRTGKGRQGSSIGGFQSLDREIHGRPELRCNSPVLDPPTSTSRILCVLREIRAPAGCQERLPAQGASEDSRAPGQLCFNYYRCGTPGWGGWNQSTQNVPRGFVPRSSQQSKHRHRTTSARVRCHPECRCHRPWP